MASSRVDVFLSFRSEDTGKTFTGHLYTALTAAGFRTFRDDDEIEGYKDIKSELDKAIQEARLSIIVFSEGYASSAWCLDQLVMILERRRTSGHVILPVYYDVDPSEVRNQTGFFAEAFSRHEEQFKMETNKWKKESLRDRVQGWREALREVANLAGMALENQADGDESKFIQKVIKLIAGKLSRTVLHVTPYLIGIRSRAQNIDSWLQCESADVGIALICGMGGIGKSTIAKFLYNLHFERFEASSFLANVREISNRPNGLVHLQRKLLSDILKRKGEEIRSIDEGLPKIKHAIGCKRVLVVLDDVDCQDQFDAVVGIRDWFHPGSKVILTTRNKHLSKANEFYKIFEVEELDFNESLKLFSWHAFAQDHPIEGYYEHSKRIVQHCGGLPLALQVLGSSLSGRGLGVCGSVLEKVAAIPDLRIFENLRKSFDSLDDHDRNLFLDIACFFIGKGKDFTVSILDECDFNTTIGIQNLIDRCLLTVNEGNKLMMHQLLRVMGQEIVRRESPKEPSKRSRLWHHKDTFNVLREETGTSTIKGLSLDMHLFEEEKSSRTSFGANNNAKRPRFIELNEESLLADRSNSLKRQCLGLLSWLPVNIDVRNSNQVELKTDAFASMREIRLLQLNYVVLKGGYKDFPKRLRWLCWHGFPLTCMPNDFPLESLVALDLRNSSLKQVWKGAKMLTFLKMLNLSHSRGLTNTPNFTNIPNLEKLVLKDCVNLVEVHKSIGVLGRLVSLNLKGCKKLKKLPGEIGQLTSLEKLILSGCSTLDQLPAELVKVKYLREFQADGISFNRIQTTIGEEDRSWSSLFSSWVREPRKSPESLCCCLPHSLVKLGLSNCNLSSDDLAGSLGSLSMLQDLNLSRNPISSLPESIKGLAFLESLWLSCCERLQSLPELPMSLGLLHIDHCSSLEMVTNLPNLFRSLKLNLHGCEKLVEVKGMFKLGPIGNADTDIIDSLGLLTELESMGSLEVEFLNRMGGCFRKEKGPLQGLYECGIYSIFLPGKKVLGWRGVNETRGSSISIIVPSLPNRKIRALNIYVVYEFVSDYSRIDPSPCILYDGIIISNETEGLKWSYSPAFKGIPEKNSTMVWLSHWKIGNPLILEGGDEVNVSASCSGLDDRVREIGVMILSDECEEEGSQHPNTYSRHHNDANFGDLSAYELRTGSYYLCHYNYPHHQTYHRDGGKCPTTLDDSVFGEIEDSSLVNMKKKDREGKSSKGLEAAIAATSEDLLLKHLESDKESLLSLKRKKGAILHQTKRQALEGRKLSPADKKFMEKLKGKCLDRYEMKHLEEILEMAGVEVLEGPRLDPGEKEELKEMKRKLEKFKQVAKFLKRRADFLHLLLSYPMKPEAEEESRPFLQSVFYSINPDTRISEASILDKSKFSIISQRECEASALDKNKFSSITQEIGKFKALIVRKYHGKGSYESADDIYRKVQELFCDVERELACYDFYMAAYLPPDSDMEHSAPRTESDEQMMLPATSKPEITKRPHEEEMLRAPQVIRKLAINSAVRQILYYLECGRVRKIGISGNGGEEVAEVLKDLPEMRHMFHVIHCISFSQETSIIELQMNVAELTHRAPNICGTCLLLVMGFIDQHFDLNDLVFDDNVCVMLVTGSKRFDYAMALDLEIRMEDHLLPWKLFCKNAGEVLDHSSTLQQKAVRLIEECHGHLLAIILLARALKGMTDVSVWELALHNLMWQPSSQVQGMSVIMINVLRFVWEHLGTRAKNCIEYCSSHDKGRKIKETLLIPFTLEELATSFLVESVGHGFVRMREETRLVLLNTFIPGKDPAFLKQGDMGLTEAPKAEEWCAWEINLMNNKISKLPESPKCPFLVKLFLQGNYDLMVIPPSFFEEMPLLQVLDLSYTSIKSLPPSVSRLASLREFFLRGCDLLIKLPPDIGALMNLEVFDLEGTQIMYLPQEIGELVCLTCLNVTINACANLYRENREMNAVIPSEALSNLSQMNELSIEVYPDGDWWDFDVKAIVNALCSLKKLTILKLYLPSVELLEDLRWNSTSLMYPTLKRFRFMVGRYEKRFITRLPQEAEQEFNNSDKGLKYINGEGIPTDISKALQHSDALFLQRHWTAKSLSQFGIENMEKLRFCLLAECNEFQCVIENGQQFYQGERDSDFTDLDFNEEIMLGSLQHLSIHYMKNMESICKGPIGRGCLSHLKSLALHTCLSLITVFTPGMLVNLINLNELVVEDCPRITSLVSMKSSDSKSGHFLRNLKKISLLELPELVSISGGLCIAPKLQRLVVFYCPKLERLSSMEVSSKDLKVIKGESEWWDSLQWHQSGVRWDHQDHLTSVFIPLRRDGDLMAQLAED